MYCIVLLACICVKNTFLLLFSVSLLPGVLAVPLKDSPNVECLKVKVFRIITDVLGPHPCIVLSPLRPQLVWYSYPWCGDQGYDPGIS